jgi:hypothetical protein
MYDSLDKKLAMKIYNSLFLSLYVITYTVEQNARNLNDLIELFHFKVHI